MTPTDYLQDGIATLLARKMMASGVRGEFGGLFSSIKHAVKSVVGDVVDHVTHPVSAIKDDVEHVKHFGASFVQGCAAGASGGLWGCIGVGAANIGKQALGEGMAKDAAKKEQEAYVRYQLAQAGVNMESPDAQAVVSNYVDQLNAAGGDPHADSHVALYATLAAGAGLLVLAAYLRR